MFILYDKNKTNSFDRNDLVLKNVTKCDVAWEKNGQYQIDLIYAITPEDTAWKSIVKGAIIKCPVPYQQDQLFRLNTPTKKLDNSNYLYIEVTGYHISYDLSYNFLEDVRPTNMNGFDAGKHILGNTQYPHNFTWNSDITDISTAYYIRQNIIDALIGDKDQSFANRWGGELVRDNFNIGMFNQAGKNRGTVIKYSKNLLGLEQSADDSNMITRVMPTITDDSTNTTDTATQTSTDSITPVITIPEKYVDSPLLNTYANIYIKEVQVTLTDDQKILPLDQKYQIMRDYVNNLYNNSHIDIPVYSYTIDFVELAKTEEYKDYAILEEVHPYDFITVKALDIDVIAELVGYTYDSIAKKYETFTLGNVRNDIIRSNQKSLFQISQQNQRSIKILQAQMTTLPDGIDTPTSGGNNLFDHAVNTANNILEWITGGGANNVTDTTLHSTSEVWEIPSGASISKDSIILNPNNFNGQEMTLSLQAKYNGVTPTVYNDVQTSNVLLGSLDLNYKACLATNTNNWVNNIAQTGIISSEYIGVSSGDSFTVTNPNNYVFILHGYDSQYNFLIDFNDKTVIPANVAFMKAEIIKTGLTPESLLLFAIYLTEIQKINNFITMYATGSDSDWSQQSQVFTLATGNSNDIITQVNFKSANNDSAGTAYVGAFMINTGTVVSDFSQSSHDTVETLHAHQIITDYISAKVADIDQLHAVIGTIDTFSSTYATITNLNATNLAAQNLTVGVAKVIDLTTGTLKAGSVTADSIQAGAITVGSAIIATGAITSALIANAAVKTAQIADGSVTALKVVDLSANSITAGTLSVDRLIIRGTNSSIVYALNNISGALQSQNVDTLNGETLTSRTLTADKIVAGAITAKEIAAHAITANEILANTITAGEIAAGTITATEILAGTITATQIDTSTLIVGDNIAMGPNAIITWNNLSDESKSNLKGSPGIQGPAGTNGVITYTWIKYATSSAGAGLNDSPAGMTYMGIAYNKLTATKSMVATDYSWSLIKGDTGSQGTPGVQGPIGANGLPTYTWIRYATSATGTGFSDSPTGMTYIGIVANQTTATEGTNPAVYSWSLIQGPQGVQGPIGLQGLQGAGGNQGIQGPSGANGVSSYTHIAYATNSTGSTGFSTTNGTGATYIGMYVDSTAADSNTPSLYTWSLIAGANGAQGTPGTNGANGTPAYLHIAYATSSNGATGFDTTVSTGKTYIGQYTDATAADSTSYTSYSWTLIQGPQGVQGSTGATGPQGPQGNQANLPSYITATKITQTTIESPTITAGSISANAITGGTLNAATMIVTNLSASAIIGGTLTLGGSTSGKEIVKNAGGLEIARLDTDGLTITLQPVPGQGYFSNAFKIKAYDGTVLMNINGDGELLYHGVMEIASLGDTTRHLELDPNGTITFAAGASGVNSLGLGNGDGELWTSHDMRLSCWDTIAFGSTANTSQAFQPTMLFGCRDGNINIKGDYRLYATDSAYYVVPKTESTGGGINYLRINEGSSPNLFLQGRDNSTYSVPIWNSDITLKKNINTSTVNATNRLNQINCYSFYWICDDKYQDLGVLSQDLQRVEDSWVIKVPQSDGTIKMQPNVSTIIPYLIKSNQELSEECRRQNSEILALQGRISALESRASIA